MIVGTTTRRTAGATTRMTADVSARDSESTTANRRTRRGGRSVSKILRSARPARRESSFTGSLDRSVACRIRSLAGSPTSRRRSPPSRDLPWEARAGSKSRPTRRSRSSHLIRFRPYRNRPSRLLSFRSRLLSFRNRLLSFRNRLRPSRSRPLSFRSRPTLHRCRPLRIHHRRCFPRPRASRRSTSQPEERRSSRCPGSPGRRRRQGWPIPAAARSRRPEPRSLRSRAAGSESHRRRCLPSSWPKAPIGVRATCASAASRLRVPPRRPARRPVLPRRPDRRSRRRVVQPSRVSAPPRRSTQR